VTAIDATIGAVAENGSGTIIRIALRFLRKVRKRGPRTPTTTVVEIDRLGQVLAPGDIKPEQPRIVIGPDGGQVFILPETVIFGSTGPSRVGEPFPTEDAAASAALKEIYAASIDKNEEFAGNIYQRADGRFAFSPPHSIGSSDVSDPGLSPVPPGSVVVGTYHSHAAGMLPTDELFSPTDKLKASFGNQPSYLLTPSGHLYKYTPELLLDPAEQQLFRGGRVTRLD
jgi:hypothetical protein